MTLNSTRTKIVYLPDGKETLFPVPFPLFSWGDVECIAVEDGNEQIMSGFTIEGMGGNTGIHVRFISPPSASASLVIRRSTRRVQESTYPEGGKLPSKVLENDLDRVVGMVQELDESVRRALKVNASREDAPESAEDLYLRINNIAADGVTAAQQAQEAAKASEAAREMAENAAGQAEQAVVLAQDAADTARDAAEVATIATEGLHGMAVRLVLVDCSKEAKVEYNPDTNSLTFYMPDCRGAGIDEILLSDAVNGVRGAELGVGASEKAVGIVNAKAESASATAKAAETAASAAHERAEVAMRTALEAGKVAENAAQAVARVENTVEIMHVHLVNGEDLTLYIRTDGNDANSGLENNAKGALSSFARAAIVARRHDMRGNRIRFLMGPGVYKEMLKVDGQLLSTASEILVDASEGVLPSITVPTGNAVDLSNGNFLLGSLSVRTGEESGSCVSVVGANLELAGAFEMMGGVYGLRIDRRGSCVFGKGSLAVTGTYETAIGVFQHSFFDNCGKNIQYAATFTKAGLWVKGQAHASVFGHLEGNATGKRFILERCSSIDTKGGGSSFLPGSEGGSIPDKSSCVYT